MYVHLCTVDSSLGVWSMVLMLLYYSTANSGYYYPSNGYGGGPRHSKYFRCTGSELRLSECQSFNETSLRSVGNDVRIECYSGMLLHGKEHKRDSFFSQPIVKMVR